VSPGIPDRSPKTRDLMGLIASVGLLFAAFRPGSLLGSPVFGPSEFFLRWMLALIACGCLAAAIAGLRGGVRLGGFLLGFALGPIGVFLAPFVRPLGRERPRP
jgi:hypothetical protein